MVRRPQPYPDFPQRRPYEGPLDLRAPEDRLSADGQGDGAPIRSPAITQALNDFHRATARRDTSEMKRAAADVVDATAAYYKMSGVPLFAHDPVPPQLLAQMLPPEHLAPGEHTNRAAANFLDLFDDTVKPMLGRQVVKHLNADAAGRSAVSAQSAPAGPPAPLRPSLPSGPPGQSGSPQSPLGHLNFNEYQADDEAPWLPGPSDPTALGPDVRRFRTPRPKPMPVIPGTRPSHQPGDWRFKARGARTELGNVLIDIGELPDAQRENLLQRRWKYPTNAFARTSLLSQGFGYFGASREAKGLITDHGGLDAPGDTVEMPTDAELVGVAQLSSIDGKGQLIQKGYTLKFDLGDGLTLAVLHIQPTPEIMKLKAQLEGKNTGRPLSTTIKMGQVLGEVDKTAYAGKNDHAHLQISAARGNFNGDPVKGFVVDPAPLFENGGHLGADADEAWREVTDFLESYKPR